MGRIVSFPVIHHIPCPPSRTLGQKESVLYTKWLEILRNLQKEEEGDTERETDNKTALDQTFP